MGGKGARSAKREFGYTPDFASILFGTYGKKTKAAFGGYYTGQEVRPIIGKAPKRSRDVSFDVFKPRKEKKMKFKTKSKKSDVPFFAPGKNKLNEFGGFRFNNNLFSSKGLKFAV